jgi:hypothetical protein
LASYHFYAARGWKQTGQVTGKEPYLGEILELPRQSAQGQLAHLWCISTYVVILAWDALRMLLAKHVFC